MANSPIDTWFATVDKSRLKREFWRVGALDADSIAYDWTDSIKEKIDSIVISWAWTVTSVTSANSDISITNTTTTPTITLNSWTSANQIVKLDSSAKLPAVDGSQLTNLPISSGDVVGPASSTDNAIARYDSTTGKLLQNSSILLGDDGTLGNVNSVKFDTTYTGTSVEGELYWDSDEHTLNLKTGLDSATLNIGREMNVLVMNSTGSTISNGKVVYINGSSGTKPTVALAQANDYAKSIKTIGIATMDIPNGWQWLITTIGYVHELNTSGFVVWDILYLDSSVTGGITKTNPTGLNYTLELGMCIYSHATLGIIDVKPKMLRAIESDEFKVVDSIDKTKQAAFNVSGITPWTRRVYTLPNQDVDLIWAISSQTLTNKSIALGTNTITGTKSQFNTAITDGDVIYVNDSPTLGTITTTGAIELGHASDTTLSRISAGVMAVEGIVIPTISSINTLTNKRITKRVVTTTQSATPTINTDNGDIFQITGLAQAITSMSTNLSGTPSEGEMVMWQITDNGTARAIAWWASFVSGTNATLPTTTVISAMKTVLFQRVGSTWKCLAVD